MYTALRDEEGNLIGVRREADGACIPRDPANRGWRAFVAWYEAQSPAPFPLTRVVDTQSRLVRLVQYCRRMLEITDCCMLTDCGSSAERTTTATWRASYVACITGIGNGTITDPVAAYQALPRVVTLPYNMRIRMRVRYQDTDDVPALSGG